jgi:hypothetical protein
MNHPPCFHPLALALSLAAAPFHGDAAEEPAKPAVNQETPPPASITVAAPKPPPPGTDKKAEADRSAKDKSTNQPPSVKLEARRAVFNGVDLGTYATLVAGGEKVAFQVPQGFNVRYSGQQVTITGAGGSGAAITVGYKAASEKADFQPAAFEAELARRYVNSQVASQYRTGVLGTNAHCLQFHLQVGADPWQGKMIFIPVREGLVSVAAISPPQRAREIFDASQQLLNSLQNTGPDGIIKFPEPQLSP